jgi:hypothetical protein
MAVVINGDTGITQAGEFNSDSTMGFKNRIINGAMVIAQRGTAAVTGSGEFPVDRFLVGNTTDGAFSAQQDSSAPTGFNTGSPARFKTIVLLPMGVLAT